MISSVGRISKRRAIPLLFSGGSPPATSGTSDFEGGGDGSDLGGYDDHAKGWSGPWVTAPFYVPGFLGLSNLYTLSDGTNLTIGSDPNGAADGFYWSAATVSRTFYAPAFIGAETFDTLTAGDVNGQGAGLYWSTTFTARNFALSFPLGMDDFSSYTVGDSVNTGAGGSAWGGAWVS